MINADLDHFFVTSTDHFGASELLIKMKEGLCFPAEIVIHFRLFRSAKKAANGCRLGAQIMPAESDCFFIKSASQLRCFRALVAREQLS